MGPGKAPRGFPKGPRRTLRRSHKGFQEALKNNTRGKTSQEETRGDEAGGYRTGGEKIQGVRPEEARQEKTRHGKQQQETCH